MRGTWLIFLLTIGARCVAQQESKSGHSVRGGGFGFNYVYQHSHGLELHGDYLYTYQPYWADHMYVIGPEAQAGGHYGSTFFVGNSIGLRQMLLFQGIAGITAKVALENYAEKWGEQDTRVSLRAGLTLLGFVSVEYGRSQPISAGPLLVGNEVLTVRLAFSSSILERVFQNVPIS